MRERILTMLYIVYLVFWAILLTAETFAAVKQNFGYGIVFLSIFAFAIQAIIGKIFFIGLNSLLDKRGKRN